MSFNHFRVKREAHALSRNNSGWNPFGHTWKRGNRRDTWNGTDVESQNDVQDAEESGSPIHPSQTAPGRFSGELNHASQSHENHSVSDPAPSQQHSGETVVDSQSSDAQDGLRKRPTNNAQDHGQSPTEPEDDNKSKKGKKERRMYKRVEPKEPFTVGNQLRRTFLNSWINILLLAAPVGIALFYAKVNGIIVFVVNFLAIIPLAALLSFATEEIALRTGETLGGLLNATFGNAVELIVAIIALTQTPPKVVIVQTSLIGSILSNLLLVMGMCFFFGGLRRQEQFFNTTVAQTAASLLALAIGSIIVPTVFDANTGRELDADITRLSRGVAVILLIVYGAYLFFQLKTHHEMFGEESKKVPAKPFKHSRKNKAHKEAVVKEGIVGGPTNVAGAHANSDPNALKSMLRNSNLSQHQGRKKDKKDDDDDEHEEPQLSFPVAIATLAAATVVIALCAEYMVDSIDAVTKNGGLKEEFVGLILLPIVGNAAEHATAVTVAIKDKMDLAIGVAVGSSMQVALFLIPLLVVIGWGMNIEDMNLSFDLFQVAVVFVAVLLVNYLIADGKSHWLEGMLLMSLYLIIAICAFFYLPPAADSGDAPSSQGG